MAYNLVRYSSRWALNALVPKRQFGALNSRDSSVAERRAHNPEVVGAIPALSSNLAPVSEELYKFRDEFERQHEQTSFVARGVNRSPLEEALSARG